MQMPDRWTEINSMKWIRRVAELRTLSAKRDVLGCDLGSEEAHRLEELETFFAECTDAPNEDDPFERLGWRAPVTLMVTYTTAGGATQTGLLRDVSGDGAFVETDAPLPPGQPTLVRVIDRYSGEEFRFSAGVVRAQEGGMALQFVGIPLALRLGHRSAQKRAA
jgi:hypothetical protein